MAIRKIITFPDPFLREPTKPVTVFDQELEQLVADMAETMYAARGAGLAANQIGVGRRIAVLDIAKRDEERDLQVFINPEIVFQEGNQVDDEGCLSVIDLSAKVKRAKRIGLKCRDLKGNSRELEAEDWLARVLQHEIDHLNGVLFIDHLSSLKRSLYKKRLRKILEDRAEREREEAEHP